MLVVLPIVALAALVWGVVLMRRWGLARFVPVVLLTGTIFGPHFFAIEGPMQISIDRVLWFAMIGAFVVGARWYLASWKPWSRGDTLLALWCGWVLFSALSHGAGPPEINPLARWIFYLCFPLGMFFVLKHSPLEQGVWHYLSLGLIALGTYLAITAIFETRGWYSLVFPRFIVDPKYIEFYGRGRGPLLNPIGTGLLINLAIATAIIAWPRRQRLGKILTVIVTLIMLTGVYCTLTRSVWMGTAATFGLIVWIYAPRRIRVWSALALCVTAFVLIAGIGDEMLRLKRDKHLSAGEAAESVKLRPILATVAWKMVQDHPLTGIGYGQYLNQNKYYVEDRSWNLALSKARPYIQHNVFLAQVVDCGLVGLILFCLVLANWWLIGLGLARNGSTNPQQREIGLLLLSALAAYAINGMFHDVSLIDMVNMYLFAIAGLASCATEGSKR